VPQVLGSYQSIKLLRDLQPLVSRFEAAFNQQLLGGRLAAGAQPGAWQLLQGALS
jgi:predicted nucleic acid-binding Zn ribbon protein